MAHVIASQNPFGVAWGCLKGTFDVISHFPLGKLNVVPWELVSRQFRIVMGVIIYSFVVNHCGGHGRQGLRLWETHI